LQTIASLNNYVIKNIIYQETTEDSDDVNISNLIPDQPHYVISKKNSLYAVTTDPNRLTSDKKFCQPCMGKSKSYIDQLKYDLFKRIELEVNRGKRIFEFIQLYLFYILNKFNVKRNACRRFRCDCQTNEPRF